MESTCEVSNACPLPYAHHYGSPCEIRRCAFAATYDGRPVKCPNPAESHRHAYCVRHAQGHGPA
jgi:hypothetical protein